LDKTNNFALKDHFNIKNQLDDGRINFKGQLFGF